MNSDVLFEHIKAVGLTPRKFQHTMVELVDMNNVERRKKNSSLSTTNWLFLFVPPSTGLRGLYALERFDLMSGVKEKLAKMKFL